jgi:hypothetical protein
VSKTGIVLSVILTGAIADWLYHVWRSAGSPSAKAWFDKMTLPPFQPSLATGTGSLSSNPYTTELSIISGAPLSAAALNAQLPIYLQTGNTL